MLRIARWTRWITPVLAALLLLFGTFGVAAAGERAPTVTPQPTKYTELEQQYRLRQSQVRSLYEMLKRDEIQGTYIAGMIDRAKAEGKNTMALEQALATYRDKLGAARAAWQTAAAALKTHAGFSDAGKVTNPDQARATLKAAGSAIEQCYKTARSAEELLSKALAVIRGRK